MSNFEIIFSEKKLTNREFNYGGTADLLVKKNDEYILIDFKSSNSIYADYLVQLSAYRHSIETEMNIKINKAIVARFPKEGDDFEIKEFNEQHLDQAFEYFKLIRQAFDQDKELSKIARRKK
jgi:predicted RecB family nuclease